MTRTAGKCGGFSYVEVLVAVALLALCAVPLADAVRNGLNAAGIGEAKALELRCMKNTMETVLAEPFDTLWNAASGNNVASAYSQPAGNGCGSRDVFIAKYEHRINSAPKVLSAGDPGDDALLLVTVSSPASGYTFATLVDR